MPQPTPPAASVATRIADQAETLLEVATRVSAAPIVAASWSALVEIIEGIQDKKARLRAINAIAALMEHQTKEWRTLAIAFKGRTIPVEEILLVHQVGVERALGLIKQTSDLTRD